MYMISTYTTMYDPKMQNSYYCDGDGCVFVFANLKDAEKSQWDAIDDMIPVGATVVSKHTNRKGTILVIFDHNGNREECIAAIEMCHIID